MGNPSTWTPPKGDPKLKTLIVVLLDRSGSMSGSERDVIGGVNTFLEDQKKIDAPAHIAFVRFDNEVERFRTMGQLADCLPLAKDEFVPRGGTALLDAVGHTLTAMDRDWSALKPDRAIMVIVTDGGENASKEFSKKQIQDAVKSRQNSDKWAFVYLGADVDAFGEAGGLGINLANTAGYTKTAAGVKAMYTATSAAVGAMRGTGFMMAANLGKANIGEDEDEALKPVFTPPPTDTLSTAPDTTAPWNPPA
jgi:uncharacterized protein YegL